MKNPRIHPIGCWLCFGGALMVLPLSACAEREDSRPKVTSIRLEWETSSGPDDKIEVDVHPAGSGKLLASYSATYPAESLELKLPTDQSFWLGTKVVSDDPTFYVIHNLPLSDPAPIASIDSENPFVVSVVRGSLVSGKLVGYEPLPDEIFADNIASASTGTGSSTRIARVQSDGTFEFSPAPCGDVEFYFRQENPELKTLIGRSSIECGESVTLSFPVADYNNFTKVTLRVSGSTGLPFFTKKKASFYLTTGKGTDFTPEQVVGGGVLHDGVAIAHNVPEGTYTAVFIIESPDSGEIIDRAVEGVIVSDTKPIDIAITYAEVELEREHNSPFFGVKAFQGDAEVGGVKLVTKGDRAFLLFDKPGIHDIELKTVAGPKRFSIDAPEGYSKYSL